ncbi:MAG TPA: FtsX-like permease family protein, partial [Terriglobia bacterium]|nr:FtsX-like permease family protein [Terriglobia bacterium]
LYASSVSLPASRYATNEQRRGFYERLEDRLRGLQGVAGVALASKLPPYAGGNQEIEIQGQPSDTGSRPHDVGADAVTPGFFELLQIPLTKGRQFDSRDHSNSTAVTIVNEALTTEYFRGRDPIGQQIRIADASDNQSPWLTIVGVVGNLKHSELMNEMRWAETPILYRPLIQEPRPAIGIALKTFTTTLSNHDIANAVNSVDVEVPVAELETLSSRVSKLMAYPNFRALVLSFFATSALLLSAVGLHGVLMQIVARRTPEFAVRRAVGARANDVIQLVLRQAGLPVLAGLCGGFICTFAFSRVISNLLYGIEPVDLIALGSVTLTLLVAAGVAIALPVIRALRIDPMIALRQD